MAQVLLFQGNILTIPINFLLPDNKSNCSLEVWIPSDLTANCLQRAISCPDGLWTSDVSSGIVNLESEIYHNLEDIKLNCSRQSISDHHQIDWQANLQISLSAVTADTGPPFDKIVVVMICACTDLDCSGFNDRHIVTYLVKSKLQILLKCRNQTITCK